MAATLNLHDILPKKNERATFIGITGSGKTTLAYYLLHLYAEKIGNPNIIALDHKGLIAWRGYTRVTTFKGLLHCKHPRIIYAPCLKELMDISYWDYFFQFIYERMHTTVYIDEVAAVTNNHDGKKKMPYYYQACLSRGRERGISTFNSTQRPKDIPSGIISESENTYVFRLKLDGDRERIKETTGIPKAAIANLQDHAFFYANLQDVSGPHRLQMQLPKSGVKA